MKVNQGLFSRRFIGLYLVILVFLCFFFVPHHSFRVIYTGEEKIEFYFTFADFIFGKSVGYEDTSVKLESNLWCLPALFFFILCIILSAKSKKNTGKALLFIFISVIIFSVVYSSGKIQYVLKPQRQGCAYSISHTWFSMLSVFLIILTFIFILKNPKTNVASLNIQQNPAKATETA